MGKGISPAGGELSAFWRWPVIPRSLIVSRGEDWTVSADPNTSISSLTSDIEGRRGSRGCSGGLKEEFDSSQLSSSPLVLCVSILERAREFAAGNAKVALLRDGPSSESLFWAIALLIALRSRECAIAADDVGCGDGALFRGVPLKPGMRNGSGGAASSLSNKTRSEVGSLAVDGRTVAKGAGSLESLFTSAESASDTGPLTVSNSHV